MVTHTHILTTPRGAVSSVRDPFDRDTIPADLREAPRWLCWRSSNFDMDLRRRRLTPVYASGERCPEDCIWPVPDPWLVTFDAALESVDRGQVDGIGLAITTDSAIIAVEIEGSTRADGTLPAAIAEDLGETYIELAPDGRGFVALYRANGARAGGDPRRGLRVHVGHGFVPICGRPLGRAAISEGPPKCVMELHAKKPPAPHWTAALRREVARVAPIDGDDEDDEPRDEPEKPLRRKKSPKGEDICGSAAPRGADGTKTKRATEAAEPPHVPWHQQGLPLIKVEPGQLPWVVDAAEKFMLEKDPAVVFQRAGQLVRVARYLRAEGFDEHEAVEKSKPRRANGTPTLLGVTAPWLVEQFARSAVWTQYDGRRKKDVLIDTPPRVAETYLARAGAWNCRALRGIVEHPVMTPSGRLIIQAGHDAQSGLLFAPNCPPPQLPDRPTREHAEHALAVLRDLLRECAFATPTDEAVALAQLLAPYVRPGLAAVPMTCYSAPKHGGGKTALAEISARVATGRAPTFISLPKGTDDELEKRLGALFMAGDTHICVDNITRSFDSEFMAQALVNEEVATRVLGASAMWRGAPLAMFSATGNNLQLRGELIRRAIMCRLDPLMERPEQRRFERNLPAFIEHHRSRLIGAALTILRAYIIAKRPEVEMLPLASYGVWTRLVRAPLVWLGVADPVASQEQIAVEDSDAADLAELLALWWARFGSESVAVKDVVSVADGPGEPNLRAAALAVAGRNGVINAQGLGFYLAKVRDRIVELSGERWRFERASGDSDKKVARWRVASIDRGNTGITGKYGDLPSQGEGNVSEFDVQSPTYGLEQSPYFPVIPVVPVVPVSSGKVKCGDCANWREIQPLLGECTAGLRPPSASGLWYSTTAHRCPHFTPTEKAPLPI